MTMYTNVDEHGGAFSAVLDAEFATADNITIASGYTGLSTINRFQDRLIDITRNGGESKLLLGMALYQGLGQQHLDVLNQLNETLTRHNATSGVYIANGRPYHGKIYKFDSNGVSNVYVGSSNFSANGIQANIECTVPVLDASRDTVIDFLDDLYSPEYSARLDKVNINVKGKTKLITNKIKNVWNNLETHQKRYQNIITRQFFSIDLNRIVENPKSNLNVYFGKGRKNEKTGIIKPRSWYEVELISDEEERDSLLYPRGNFLAYTDDGLVIPMATNGDYFKNIRSKNGLQILGIWIKGKLEKAGALDKYELVTQDTLKEYGSHEIRFYHLQGNEYYMTF